MTARDETKVARTLPVQGVVDGRTASQLEEEGESGRRACLLATTSRLVSGLPSFPLANAHYLYDF